MNVPLSSQGLISLRHILLLSDQYEHPNNQPKQFHLHVLIFITSFFKVSLVLDDHQHLPVSIQFTHQYKTWLPISDSRGYQNICSLSICFDSASLLVITKKLFHLRNMRDKTGSYSFLLLKFCF